MGKGVARKVWPDGSVGELAQYVAPRVFANERCPAWPPDVFAVAGTLLQRTGAYVRVVELADEPKRLLGSGWVPRVVAYGRRWRASLAEFLRDREINDPSELPWDSFAGPRELDRAWRAVHARADQGLGPARSDDELCRALLELYAAADEASAGLGVEPETRDPVLPFAARALARTDWLSICVHASAEKVRVLPKRHTSQRGITLRSLSHHLALCPSPEIRAEWRPNWQVGKQLDLINLLLLPWPDRLEFQDFTLVEPSADLPELPDRFRFFEFRRRRASHTRFAKRLRAAISAARQRVDHLDAIVFPELALTWREYLEAEKIAAKEEVVLIAGVALDDSTPGLVGRPQNVCLVQPAGITGIAEPRWWEQLRIVQAKNHRWCLDENQIQRYGLSGRLPASKDCWELSQLGRRGLSFVSFGSWLTMCVLICEDLARQDPITDVVRSVGPNLIVCLLMDGPQLKSRWSSRYASILAEDPGSSVLTLTSFGMTRLGERGPIPPDRSGVVALWRDVERGEREIELGAGEDACIVSVVCKSKHEFTADGRGDGREAHFPVLAGVHPLALRSAAAKAR